jgi:3-deoxy-D-manno-octulosonate 8-phosphate phosphatase (KDO 8-P phosphatase)
MTNKKMNFLLDVDGVLTDGCYYYDISGKIMKKFGAHDHDGLKLVKNLFNISFITADHRGFNISKKRIVDDMGYKLDLVTESERFDYVNNNYDLKNLVFMGDGFYDAKVLKDCFLGIAPKSANKFALQNADYITESNAGYGAVFDACIFLKNKFSK